VDPGAQSKTHGRSQTAKEMAMYGALTAILSNIENKNYIENVLSRVDFLNEFVSMSPEEMDNARKLVGPNPSKPIVRKDWEMKPVLDIIV